MRVIWRQVQTPERTAKRAPFWACGRQSSPFHEKEGSTQHKGGKGDEVARHLDVRVFSPPLFHLPMSYCLGPCSRSLKRRGRVTADVRVPSLLDMPTMHSGRVRCEDATHLYTYSKSRCRLQAQDCTLTFTVTPTSSPSSFASRLLSIQLF